ASGEKVRNNFFACGETCCAVGACCANRDFSGLCAPAQQRNTYLVFNSLIESIRSTEPRNTAITRCLYSRNTAGTLKYSIAPHESNLLQRALVGPSVNVFCQKKGRNCRSGAETVGV
ncbi:unnamed protein product, partial [Laminaria digitata]